MKAGGAGQNTVRNLTEARPRGPDVLERFTGG